MHQTAREFLIAKTKVLDGGWKHSLDPVQCDLILATSCIAILMVNDLDNPFKWDATSDDDDDHDGTGFFQLEFVEYASCFWAVHFRQAQTDSSNRLFVAAGAQTLQYRFTEI
jgi:hypothetical protein